MATTIHRGAAAAAAVAATVVAAAAGAAAAATVAAAAAVAGAAAVAVAATVAAAAVIDLCPVASEAIMPSDRCRSLLNPSDDLFVAGPTLSSALVRFRMREIPFNRQFDPHFLQNAGNHRS
jgi:hypothetical protein